MELVLLLATMNLISTKNGRPANFLDVGGRATDEQVVAALKIMDSNLNAEYILVNIFAGIVRLLLSRCHCFEFNQKHPVNCDEKANCMKMKGPNIEEIKQIILIQASIYF